MYLIAYIMTYEHRQFLTNGHIVELKHIEHTNVYKPLIMITFY